MIAVWAGPFDTIAEIGEWVTGHPDTAVYVTHEDDGWYTIEAPLGRVVTHVRPPPA